MDSRFISRTRGLCAAICLTLAMSVVGSSPAALGASIYSTGFEGPTFTTGPLIGQDGWVDLGNGAQITVENTLVESGTQAVQFSATGATGQIGAGRYDTVNSGVLSISVDVRRASGGTPSGAADLAVFDSNGTDVAVIRWASDNDLDVIAATTVDLPGLLTPDNWYNVRLDLNYSTHTLNALLDDQVVASGIGFDGNDTFLAGGIFVQGPGTDNIYFDNYAVATPLPSSLAAGLVLGGVGALAQLRRRVRNA